MNRLKSRYWIFQQHGDIIGEVLEFLAIIVFVVIPIRMFVAQPFRVSGESMINTFQDKDYLIVDEISYRFIEPKRGDVIVFKHPESGKYLIKRIIGLPGDTVSLRGTTVSVKNTNHPKGVELPEPFLDNVSDEYAQDIVVTDGHFFVMGDNRPYSSDSRSWGLLPVDNVVGRTLLRLYPFDKIDAFPGFVDSYPQG